MPAYKATAIVLKKTKLKEKDLILTMLSSTGQQLRAVAKGAQRPGGSFAAKLEVFSVVDLMLYQGKSLDTITEARMVESNESCRSDLTRLSYGAVMAELVEKTALEGQEMPVLFSLTCTALKSLGVVQEPLLPFVSAAYLIKALSFLGYKPSLDYCTICGTPVDATSSNSVFSITAGGCVCAECSEFGELEPDDVVDANVVAWIKTLLGLTFEQIEQVLPQDPSAQAGYSVLAGEVLTFCEHWANVHLGLRLKSLDFLSRI